MDTLQKLETLSRNLWWSWHPEAIELFRQLNPGAFRAAGNSPVAALRQADPAVLAQKSYQAEVDEVFADFDGYMTSRGKHADAPRTAYFCMEFGLHESLPLYSGGLGILAGDHVKAASDVGLPFVAVGLFLRDGYFKQYFDPKGWQQDEYPSIDATRHPVELVRGPDGSEVVVTVHSGWQTVHLRAWRLKVGRSTLYLLDTDFDENPYELRFLTRRLYQGNRTTRLQQEIILGIGGLRMLRALGEQADVYHMNEGHCALMALELLRERRGWDHQAEDWVRQHCVFTTHTPVAAGHDRFDPALFLEQMAQFREQIGFSEHELLGWGRVNPHDISEQFTMTVLGLKLARSSNGVSRLNGEVARRQWHHLYADRAVENVPIGHVTNGIHLPTWTSPKARGFLADKLGEDWMDNREESAVWDRLSGASDRELWAYRSGLRTALIDYVKHHIRYQTMPQTANLDPDVLTIGFARRFATYKRAPLLFSDLDRAAALFNDPKRPIQVIYAGKAHPADKEGQRFIHQIFELTQDPRFNGRLVFLENYNMEVGRMLVSGSDVWLNNPRRPYEASGTSGQKVAIHGGLNLSILDGWWPEGYDGTNGWAIGSDAGHEYKDPAVQDPEDANFLYQTLAESVVPEFYDRKSGVPEAWVARMRSAMSKLSYEFSAHRMICDYIDTIYADGVEA
ncbi:MAG: alpha-glucan family phosphorylase [Rhodothermales bacterium]|nr:alpha-glucan family phosphorylase [Rhodothermales bacterium]MBO6778479.1 alpha-glucan family phosphorylase [Rhodothermales bacterium]